MNADKHGNSELGHILPLSYYRNTLFALLALTVLTVAVSNVQFETGALNIIVAMLVASVKAMLVALFFMHLRYEHPVTWVYAALPIILLVILLSGLFIDNPFRPDPRQPMGSSIMEEHAPANPLHHE